MEGAGTVADSGVGSSDSMIISCFLFFSGLGIPGFGWQSSAGTKGSAGELCHLAG